MSESLSKRADEKFPIELEYPATDVTEQDAITEVDVTVTPEGLDINYEPIVEGRVVKQMIAGGTAGVDYVVTVKTTTTLGNIFIEYIVVKVM